MLFDPLVLPNGTAIPNRVAKAAMEENLGAADLSPSARLVRLYERWAQGGAGLIITGNVMVDAHALTGAGGVVLDGRQQLAPFKAWAQAAKTSGARVWMQINHPGRQAPRLLGQPTIAPSAVPLDLGRHSGRFETPRAMTDADIARVVEQFAETASLAEQSGFDGVEIHAAHGYLLSQFLSPLANRRTDGWGGSLENRARLLFDVIRAIRSRVSHGFAVGVKLNSADFQRGGFSDDEAFRIIQWLSRAQIDLIEISGGTYEKPAMQGQIDSPSTRAREAYFLEFAARSAQVAAVPLMLTGGIRTREGAESVRAAGVAIVGLATSLAIDPDLPNRWRRGPAQAAELRTPSGTSSALASAARMAMVKHHLRRLADGQSAHPHVHPLAALATHEVRSAMKAAVYRRKLARRPRR